LSLAKPLFWVIQPFNEISGKTKYILVMLSRNQRRSGKQDLHFLNEEGMVTCNPRDKEASHRAEVECIATSNLNEVTCRKCWKVIRKMGVNAKKTR